MTLKINKLDINFEKSVLGDLWSSLGDTHRDKILGLIGSMIRKLFIFEKSSKWKIISLWVWGPKGISDGKIPVIDQMY